jgi:quinone-reactive Ni/Fe-hydrogenase small subunit
LDVQKKYRGEYVLIVEGGIPLGAGGKYATLGEKGDQPIAFSKWVKDLSVDAKAIIAVGSCATFGGLPAAAPNPT